MQYTHLTKAYKVEEKITRKLQSNPLSRFSQMHSGTSNVKISFLKK